MCLLCVGVSEKPHWGVHACMCASMSFVGVCTTYCVCAKPLVACSLPCWCVCECESYGCVCVERWALSVCGQVYVFVLYICVPVFVWVFVIVSVLGCVSVGVECVYVSFMLEFRHCPLILSLILWLFLC